MDEEVGKVMLGVELVSQNMNSQVTSMAKSATSVAKKAFGALGLTMGAAALVGFTKSCISLGSDLAEVQNVVDNSFKSMSSSVNSFSKDAIAQFGLSETVAKKYMGTIGAMNNAFGIAESESFKMGAAVTGLAGDVASFYNISSDEAFTKLKSIWTGETESLKELGVVMTQTALDEYALNNGLGKTTAKMTEQEKVMLRYQYVTNALSTAAGDFMRTQDGWANQTRVLSLRFDSLKATLGQGFINLFTPLLRIINNLIAKIQVLADGFVQMTELFTGKSATASGISSISDDAITAADSISSMGDSAVASAKEATKALAGFDEITKISDTSSDSASATGSSAISIPGIETSETDSAVDKTQSKLANFLEWTNSYFNKNFADIFKNSFDKTKIQFNRLQNIMSKAWKDMKSLAQPIGEWFNTDFTAMLQAMLSTSADIFNRAFDTFNTIFSDIWNVVVFPCLSNFTNIALPILTQFTTELITTFGSLYNDLSTVFDMLWQEAVMPAITLIMNIFDDLCKSIDTVWNEHGKPIFEKLREAISSTASLCQTIWNQTLQPIFDSLYENIDWIWENHLKALVDNLLDFVATTIECGLQIYNDFILPIVSYLANIFGPAFDSTFSFIFAVISTITAAIIDTINGIVEVLKGMIKFITGVFTNDWGMAWEGIKEIFTGVWMGFEGLVKSIVNILIDILNGFISGFTAGINTIVRGINSIGFTLPDYLGGYSWSPGLSEFTAMQIPKLAQGAIIDTPTLAMVGEAGKEAVMPLENNTGWISQLASDIAQRGGAGGDVVAVLTEILAVLREIRDSLSGEASVMIGEEEIAVAVLKGIAKLKSIYGMDFEF